MLRVIGVIILMAAYISFAVDVVRTPATEARTLPRWLWLVIVLLVPILGGLFWMALGRTWHASGSRWRRRGPVAPDDDPRFLRQLDEEAWRQRMRQRRGEGGEIGGADPTQAPG